MRDEGRGHLRRRLAAVQAQVLAGLAASGLANLSLLPTCGAKFYAYRSGWQLLYSEDLTPAHKAKITGALDQALTSLGFAPAKTCAALHPAAYRSS